MASNKVEGFALRETIHLTYRDVKIGGVKQETLVGLEIHYTVRHKADRTKILNESHAGTKITPVENGSDPYIGVEIDTDPDTNGASTAFTHGVWYEFDCWVVSSIKGKGRVDNFSFMLDEPETDEFTV